MKPLRDDTEIIAAVVRVLEGDEAAKIALIEQIQDRLYKFCLLTSRNRQLAEDLCQETLIKAFQNLHTLKEPATFVGWVFQIARNLLIDLKRRPVNKEIQPLEFAVGTANSVNHEAIMTVQKVLASFEPDDRLLLLLIELEGYSYKEAGEIVGLSEDAVRSKLHRLKTAFIKKFNSQNS
jgi:RNA polymerase sigma-70 factor (ECF subfamily)